MCVHIIMHNRRKEYSTEQFYFPSYHGGVV